MFCDVVLSNMDPTNGKENTFQLVNIADDGSSIVPPNQAGVEIFSCPDDYIAINYVRLCGERLNDGSLVADASVNKPVTYSSAGPIVIAVQTDQSTVGRGFKLTYTQLVCTNKIR
uniref:CUB domain-containing protein n=1 Tax=Anopheles culicifacies TaxID=139723 RepID=A0A182MV88_9DIPT